MWSHCWNKVSLCNSVAQLFLFQSKKWFIFIFYLCICVHMSLHVPWTSRYQKRLEEGMGFPRVSGGYELPGVGVKKLMPCLLIHPSIPYSTLLNDLKVETVKEYEVLNPSYSYSLWSSIHIDYIPVQNTKTKIKSRKKNQVSPDVIVYPLRGTLTPCHPQKCPLWVVQYAPSMWAREDSGREAWAANIKCFDDIARTITVCSASPGNCGLIAKHSSHVQKDGEETCVVFALTWVCINSMCRWKGHRWKWSDATGSSQFADRPCVSNQHCGSPRKGIPGTPDFVLFYNKSKCCYGLGLGVYILFFPETNGNSEIPHLSPELRLQWVWCQESWYVQWLQNNPSTTWRILWNPEVQFRESGRKEQVC